MLRIMALVLGCFVLLGGTVAALATSAPATSGLDPENTLYLDLKDGRVVIKLMPDLAPNHVERLKTLTRQGFYNGVVFHRVLEGFMAQSGDPTGTGMGGSNLPDLKAEFSAYNFGRGTVGAARSQDPDSANSQFYICFQDCSFLNGQYTVWGQVVSGMDYVDHITRIDPEKPNPSITPDKILKMQVAADADKASPEAQ